MPIFVNDFDGSENEYEVVQRCLIDRDRKPSASPELPGHAMKENDVFEQQAPFDSNMLHSEGQKPSQNSAGGKIHSLIEGLTGDLRRTVPKIETDYDPSKQYISTDHRPHNDSNYPANHPHHSASSGQSFSSALTPRVPNVTPTFGKMQSSNEATPEQFSSNMELAQKYGDLAQHHVHPAYNSQSWNNFSGQPSNNTLDRPPNAVPYRKLLKYPTQQDVMWNRNQMNSMFHFEESPLSKRILASYFPQGLRDHHQYRSGNGGNQFPEPENRRLNPYYGFHSSPAHLKMFHRDDGILNNSHSIMPLASLPASNTTPFGVALPMHLEDNNFIISDDVHPQNVNSSVARRALSSQGEFPQSFQEQYIETQQIHNFGRSPQDVSPQLSQEQYKEREQIDDSKVAYNFLLSRQDASQAFQEQSREREQIDNSNVAHSAQRFALSSQTVSPQEFQEQSQQEEQSISLFEDDEKNRNPSLSLFETENEVENEFLAMEGSSNVSLEPLPFVPGSENQALPRKLDIEKRHVKTYLREDQKALVTQFTFSVMSQLEVVKFNKRDRRGNRGKTENGAPGLACLHCKGATGRTGRYFPSTIRTLADSKKTLFAVNRHLLECQKCPADTKANLHELFCSHLQEKQVKRKRHGSQRAFFRQIWEIMHADYSDPKDTSSDEESDEENA